MMDAFAEAPSRSQDLSRSLFLRIHATSAIALGFVSGAASVVLRLALTGLEWLFTQHSGPLPEVAASLSLLRRAVTPALGAVCAWAILSAVSRWNRAEFFQDYVEAVRFSGGRMAFVPTLWRTISCIFSVSSGAAIGREGAIIQFSASITSWIGRRSLTNGLPLSRQVACSVAAAVAALYHSPFAGIFFAAEIVVGKITWRDFPTLALSSFMGYLTSSALLGGGPLFPPHSPVDLLSIDWVYALLFASFVGVLGPLYQKLMCSFQFAARWPVALGWSGLVVGLFSIAQPMVWGNGDSALLFLLQVSPPVQSVFSVTALRIVATAFSAGTGTVGGIFTPTLFAGAAIGLSTGELLHLSNPAVFSIAGIGSLTAAVTHAPWMAALITVELTGQWHDWLPILACCFLSSKMAAALSSRCLYAISTPTPAKQAESAREAVCR
jgi:CIC family chloride channel protein